MGQRAANYPALRYVLIVGDDRVVPFARVTIPAAVDPAWVSEALYRGADSPPYLATDSPTGYALNENLTLSDNIYGTQITLGEAAWICPPWPSAAWSSPPPKWPPNLTPFWHVTASCKSTKP